MRCGRVEASRMERGVSGSVTDDAVLHSAPPSLDDGDALTPFRAVHTAAGVYVSSGYRKNNANRFA